MDATTPAGESAGLSRSDERGTVARIRNEHLARRESMMRPTFAVQESRTGQELSAGYLGIPTSRNNVP